MNGENVLRPFEGIICPGIAFESGHVIWFLKFEETPIPVGGYSTVWLESPEGKLTLYADPTDAEEYITDYHDFDRTTGATIDWHTANDNVIDLKMEGSDGTTLKLHARLNHSLETRLMETVDQFVPDTALQTEVGVNASSAVFDCFMGSNQTKLRGETETGTEYWAAADRLRSVTETNATLNGTDLGRQVQSPSSHDYGDISTSRESYITFGTLWLEYPVPG